MSENDDVGSLYPYEGGDRVGCGLVINEREVSATDVLIEALRDAQAELGRLRKQNASLRRRIDADAYAPPTRAGVFDGGLGVSEAVIEGLENEENDFEVSR